MLINFLVIADFKITSYISKLICFLVPHGFFFGNYLCSLFLKQLKHLFTMDVATDVCEVLQVRCLLLFFKEAS